MPTASPSGPDPRWSSPGNYPPVPPAPPAPASEARLPTAVVDHISSMLEPPASLADHISAILDRLARNSLGVRVATALALAWAWITVVSLTASLSREVIEMTRGYSYAPTFGKPDPSNVARALGGLILMFFVIPTWTTLGRLTKRSVGLLHYLATDQFEFFSTKPRPKMTGVIFGQPATEETKAVDINSLHNECSFLLEHTAKWFRCYMLGWVAVLMINALSAVITGFAIPLIWPHNPLSGIAS